uniref:Uncharacterized protein n=1 Tax=Solanum tuberosum TaxID=4113 RepID=M1AJ63_SOLTU
MSLEVVFRKQYEPRSDEELPKQCFNTKQNSGYVETDKTTPDVQSLKDFDGARASTRRRVTDK